MNATYQMLAGAGVAGDSPLQRQPSVPCRGPLEVQLEELKERLLNPWLSATANTALVRECRWAATEATALAWYTAYPILLLPVLLEEKVRAALAKWEKQEQIRQR